MPPDPPSPDAPTLPDSADAFLAAAVRSFDDNAELQRVAKRELALLLENAPVAAGTLAPRPDLPGLTEFERQRTRLREALDPAP